MDDPRDTPKSGARSDPASQPHGASVGAPPSGAAPAASPEHQEAQPWRTHEALAAAEFMLNSLHDAVSIMDRGEVYRMVNDAWCRDTGITRERVLGRHRGEVFPGGASPRRDAALRACLERGETHVDRFQDMLADGSSAWLEATLTPFRDVGGQVQGVITLTRDIGSARVWTFSDITLETRALDALRTSGDQQRALMDAFPGYVAVMRQDMVYVYMNQRLADILGVVREKAIGSHAREVLGARRAGELAELFERVRAGGGLITERSFPATRKRARLDMQVTHLMHDLGAGEWGFYAFGIDITDRKRAEEALIQARDEAERANRTKSIFLASVSHELRTPLNAILGFSQLMREDADMSPAATASAAAEIQHAGQHLLTLVGDLIDLGQVDGGQLELHLARVPVETAINEGLSMVAPLAAQRGIRIVFTGGEARHASLHADPMRLRQVLINLLSNAIKYNRDDGTVRVRCEWRGDLGDPSVAGDLGDRGGQMVRLAIEDTGFGIAPEVASRGFSAFDRLGAERGVVQGTGIGLVISRHLVHAMGGSIGFESRPLEGSTFWIDLPQAGAAQGTARANGAQGMPKLRKHPGKNAPRVLVAEDYAPNQAVLRLQLRSLGCEADVVNDGVQAFARWEKANYDLIVTDLDMPHMDGQALARAIRRQERARGGRIPLVAVSAAILGDERRACLDAGISELLVKPVSIEQLAAVLARWLETPIGEEPAPVDDEQAAPETPSAPDNVLNLAYLYQVLGRESTAQARKLIATFVEAARAGLRDMLRLRADPEVLRREMHRQQSSARTVGALRYADLARGLEQVLRSDGVPADLDRWLAHLGAEMAEVEQALARIEALPARSGPLPLGQDSGLSDMPPGDAPLCASVLVVDDDPVVLMQMRQMLRGIGVAEVTVARNGADAIEAMNRRAPPFEVVVFDLNMPEMDGVEMIRRFSKNGFAGGLILMSGADEQLMATVGRLAGMQGLFVLGYVHKPATPAAMRALLGRSKGTSAGAAPAPEAVAVAVAVTPDSIRTGVARQEFSVWFQPKVEAHTLKPVGVEALARWRRADGVFVPPDVFIVVAERAGIIDELSAVLLATALHEGARLHAAGFPLRISINLSALWLDDLALPDLLVRSAATVGLKPADIMFEVTETGLAKDMAVALEVLSRMRLKGFGLSIDDFGIGYSSFEQLGRIPFTEMKLDRGFVNRGTQDSAAMAILESSMAMARRLSLATVAEGVETDSELRLMRALDCDNLQGYLIARPMPTSDLIRWLRGRPGA